MIVASRSDSLLLLLAARGSTGTGSCDHKNKPPPFPAPLPEWRLQPESPSRVRPHLELAAKGSTSRRIARSPHRHWPPVHVHPLAEQGDCRSPPALRSSKIPFGLLSTLVGRVLSA